MSVSQAGVRRAAIAALLEESDGPISATALAERFHVSRQIIVGDVALLRAGGEDISATPRGYVRTRPSVEQEVLRAVACVHTPEDMGRELCVIVDNGGEVLDVIVEHPVYGQLTGVLRVRSRYDIDEFLRRVEAEGAKPLSDLTGGIHLHTLRCPDETAFLRITAALNHAGFLLHM